MRVNMNNRATAVLTAYGADIYNSHYSDVPAKYRPEPVQAGDTIDKPLWDLMAIFAETFFNGNPNVAFMDNHIEIAGPEN